MAGQKEKFYKGEKKMTYEPEPMSDEDICRLEEEVFLTISDETLCDIYWRLHLNGE